MLGFARCGTQPLLVALLLLSPLASALASPVETPTTPKNVVKISAVIAADGMKIASPTVEMFPGSVVELSMRNGNGEGVDVFLGASEVLKTAAGVAYVHLELWLDGHANDREAKHNASSIGVPLGQVATMVVSAPDGRAFSVSATADARPVTASDLEAYHACATASQPLGQQKADTRPLTTGCCSAACPRRPGVVMTCCGAISCCDSTCGACCSPGGGGGGGGGGGPPRQEP